MPIYKYVAKESSPIEKHIHSTRFLQNEFYFVKPSINEGWFLVSGKFGNSLGGFERKENSFTKEVCKKYLSHPTIIF